MIHHQVLIVGGGEAGLSVAGQLLKESPGLDVAIIEPSEHHDFQRMWLMAGAGVIQPGECRRDKASLMPQGALWVKDAVCAFDPDSDSLRTASGQTISYNFLVVAPGIQTKWERVPGLCESLGRDGVCSAYAPQTLVATWNNIQRFMGGVALFTQPAGVIKCPSGSQQMCFMAEEHFRQTGVRDKTQMIFVSGAASLFPVAQYAQELEQLAKDKGVQVNLELNLVEVRAASKQAVFRHVVSGEERVIRYDLLHVAPPMGPFDFVAQSDLADQVGLVDVDPHTLRHHQFPNVFGLGDAANLPTTKTAVAIRKQAPVLARNLIAALELRPLTAKYDGFSLCHIMAGYNSVLRTEVDYSRWPVPGVAAR
jgi:sulfide:quinone oxidoreductase